MTYTVRELGPETFSDFEQLALKQGFCWCMYYQRPKPVLKGGTRKERREANRRDKPKLVAEGRSHAILVYEDETPLGWCQYGTREELPRIDASRNYRNAGAPVVEGRLWRVTCFFVDRAYRGRGVAKFALKAALESIRREGGGIVEAYPVVNERRPEYRWFGVPSMFLREGFEEVGPMGTTGILMRKAVRGR